MIRVVVAAAIAAVLGAAGCGDGEVNIPPDAARPMIDPAPYYTTCSMSDPASCAAPYECVIPDLSHDPIGPVCLVPCESDRDCPADNFCNGVRQSADTGATYHCVNDV
jgi:hypothetical protein